MTEVPAATPHAVPAELPMVATDVLLLLHVPPAVASLRVVQVPAHMVVVPMIAAGNGLTVATIVVVQPPLMVYEIVAVPAEMPQSVPVLPMVATDTLLLLQVPPDMASLSVVQRPAQTDGTPLMAAGAGKTISVVVMKHPVPTV
jgi:hypothetical protein